MTAKEFKTELKKIEDHLRGKLLQFVIQDRKRYSCTPFRNLTKFGYAILDAEKYYNSFAIRRVFLPNHETKDISSFGELMDIIKSGIEIKGIGFDTCYNAGDFGECLRYDGMTE